MFARIYQPAQSAMQSGRGAAKWTLQFQRSSDTQIDPLTGTYRSSDMQNQIKLEFDSVEEAIAYAKSKNIPHRVINRAVSKPIPRSYSENFSFERKHPWTH